MGQAAGKEARDGTGRAVDKKPLAGRAAGEGRRTRTGQYWGGEGRAAGVERGGWTSEGQGIRGVTGRAAGTQARDGARRGGTDSGRGAAGGGADGVGRVAGRAGTDDRQTRPLQRERNSNKFVL